MMGEFVEHDVFAIRRVAAAVEHFVPRQADFALLQHLPVDRHVLLDQSGVRQVAERLGR